MKTTLTKLPPAWHGQIAAELLKDFAVTNELSETAKQRRARLGFMFIFVKEMGKADGSIPHGQLKPWMKSNCAAIPLSTAGDYIAEANSLCECLGWQKTEIRIFAPHRLLASNPDDLNDEDLRRRIKLLDTIGNKSKFRAVTRYSQTTLEDDESVNKRGRAEGEGGRPADLKGTIEEVAAARKKQSWRHACKAADELEKVGIDFIALDDGQNTKLLAAYERSAKCLRAWLNTPATKRDGKEIHKLWKTL